MLFRVKKKKKKKRYSKNSLDCYFRSVETFRNNSSSRRDVKSEDKNRCDKRRDEKAKARYTADATSLLLVEMGNGAETIRDSITIGSDRRSNAIHRPAINTEKWVISHLELRAAWEEE